MARGVPCRWLMPLLHWCRRCGFPRLYLRPPSNFGAPTFLPSFLPSYGRDSAGEVKRQRVYSVVPSRCDSRASK